MNILIVGSGGREHALAWKCAQSPLAEKVFVAPGNAGTELDPQLQNVAIDAEDTKALVRFALEMQVGLVVIGPEAPLVAGARDQFCASGITCFGPSADAAQLEGSKAFTKDFLKRRGIPSADYQVFSELEPALAYLEEKGAPIVVKADGLAAGKGVIVAQTLEEAQAAVRDILDGKRFGESGQRVVIEDFLEGEEASFIVLSDGKDVLPMASSQDHKRAFDGDQGPNTGGMGAYSPAPIVDEAMHERILEEIIRPTIKGMASEGRTYTGFLYAGLMIGSDGQPRVIEYNCRFGDPETQPIMMRLRSDLVAHLLACFDETLEQQQVLWDPRPAVGVVMAAGGYPGTCESGKLIRGLPGNRVEAEQEQGSDEAAEDLALTIEESTLPADTMVFHAGTRITEQGVVTAGGRVLCVTALGDSVAEAAARAYALADTIHWQNLLMRRDIGHRAIAREQS